MEIITEKIKQWQCMAANNEHSERLVDMAVYFGLYDYAMMFKRFADMDYLTPAHFYERMRLWEAMIQRIMQDYGKEIADEVYHLQ
jgi:hypothetical protein